MDSRPFASRSLNPRLAYGLADGNGPKRRCYFIFSSAAGGCEGGGSHPARGGGVRPVHPSAATCLQKAQPSAIRWLLLFIKQTPAYYGTVTFSLFVTITRTGGLFSRHPSRAGNAEAGSRPSSAIIKATSRVSGPCSDKKDRPALVLGIERQSGNAICSLNMQSGSSISPAFSRDIGPVLV